MAAGRNIVESSPNAFWDLYSRYYDSVYNLMPYRKLLWDVFEALELEPGMRVLDAGCGTGNFEHFIAGKTVPPIKLDALDFSPKMLAVAAQKCRSLLWTDFERADLNGTLPYDDATFDRIFSINVFYTLPDPDRTLAELMRVLKPGGKLILTGPAPGYGWGPLVVEHFQRLGNIWGAWRRFARTLSSVWMLCTSALGAFLLNVFVIYRREGSGEYHAMDEGELRALLLDHEKNGLRDFQIVPTFADQNLFALAMKAA